MRQTDTAAWERMADWAESDAPLSDDSSPALTGERAREAGHRFLQGR